jgi:hypothetical protein
MLPSSQRWTMILVFFHPEFQLEEIAMPQLFFLFFFLLFGSHASPGTATHQNASSASTSVGGQTADGGTDAPNGGGACDPSGGGCGN